jgi:hypothetical protein
MVQPQGGQTALTPEPTRCFVPDGHATSPGAARHAFIDPGGAQAALAQVDCCILHNRRAWVTTFAGTGVAADVHVPGTAVGASTRASIPKLPLCDRHAPPFVWCCAPAVPQAPPPLS